MAGDWIKMRASLSTNPKVGMIAEIIGKSEAVGRRLLGDDVTGTLERYVTRDVTRDITIGALLRVWCAANEHTDDGVMHNCSLHTIDQAAGVPGFAAAMQAAGWLEYDQEERTVTFPDFLENNAPAKSHARSTGAERQARYREKKRQQRAEGGQGEAKSDASNNGNGDVTRNVTVTSQSDAREDKRKNNINTPHTPQGGNQGGEKKRSAVSLKTYLADCKAKGVKPVPDDDSVFDYAQQAKIPSEYLELHWREFLDRYKLPDAKRYKDWRSVFRKSVRGNWFHLWRFDANGECLLSTQGVQAQNIHSKRAA